MSTWNTERKNVLQLENTYQDAKYFSIYVLQTESNMQLTNIYFFKLICCKNVKKREREREMKQSVLGLVERIREKGYLITEQGHI